MTHSACEAKPSRSTGRGALIGGYRAPVPRARSRLVTKVAFQPASRRPPVIAGYAAVTSLDDLPLRLLSWPLFDPGRKQLHYFSDARGPQVGSAGCRIDPAQIGLAVELGQGVEERRSCRVGLKGRRDIVG